MECPKCHKNISDNTLICPYCHKVLALTCPNCHSISQSAICSKCGYIILEKCSKCGKMSLTANEVCKCGFPVATSIAYNECEIDEFACLIVSFSALNKIRSSLASQELYAKFLIKLNNLVTAQIKDIGAHVIKYGNIYTVNFNKELSFPTSVNKAVRLALKLVTAFTGLNSNLIDQLHTPLKLTITILKKNAEELLVNKSFERNVKLMIRKNEGIKYLNGMQVILDQYCQDTIRDYKTDSLYSLDIDNTSVMFYEILLDNYIVPPSENNYSKVDLPANKIQRKSDAEAVDENDLYGFKVFDINAKCQFKKSTAENLLKELDINNKITAIRTRKELCIKIDELAEFYKSFDFTPIYISCTEDLSYKPWGFFEKLFKEYFNLSITKGLIDPSFDAGKYNIFKKIVLEIPDRASKPEDARYTYMEQMVELLSELKRTVIIVDGFENIDDTSIQILELYFDKYMKVYTNFVFITDKEVSVHSRIKSLLQTFLYTEITLLPDTMDNILSGVKEDASDFIQSFYYERIKENFKGSKLYFEHAVKYLMDKKVLTKFENQLIIQNNSSVMLPRELSQLLRTRLKSLGKCQDASMILAYSAFLGERLDFKTLELLGINNIVDNVRILNNEGFTYSTDNIVYINNYNLIKPTILESLKKEVEEFLVKNILAKLGKILDNTSLLLLMRNLSMQKEVYMLLWKNTQIAFITGDYDAYLKNCLAYLSLIDKISDNIPPENVDKNKKEIFQNILMNLYAYSPAKIYSIENILLMDAMNSEDNEKIIKLSNLMLQGALISSNYTEALSLLHNILTRMQDTSLVVNGVINTKFLLLSLVNIEILFNIGDYRNCIDTANEVLNILQPNIIQKIKPANFSDNLFFKHLSDTFRLVSFAKFIANDNDIEQYFEKVKSALGEEFSDKKSILAIKEFISGKSYTPSNIELASAFSKIIFLILQELSNLKDNYKVFAQNIYQAKLLAADIHQTQLESLCDLFIGYAYGEIGITQKANAIISDVLEKAENSAMFNIVVAARYLMAKNKLKTGNANEALILINDTLADIQKRDNQAQVYYAMFERLFIDVAKQENIASIDIKTELKKLIQISPNGEMDRIIRRTEILSELPQEGAVIKKKPFVQDNPDKTEESKEQSFANTSTETETHA